MQSDVEAAREDRLTFLSFDGEVEARTGQGDHCVLVQIVGPGQNAGIVFSDDEAEAFGQSLIVRARYSRLPEGVAVEPSAPADDLGAAWRAAEEALPHKGATITIWSHGLEFAREYQAAALVPGSPVGSGLTPAAALLALASRLSEAR